MLRILFRVMIISAIIFIISIYYYSAPDNDEILQDYNFSNPPKKDIDNNLDDDIQDGTKRPEEGLSVYIGKSAESLVKDYGEPRRKDPTAYGYEWWIYNGFDGTYMQAGIQNGSVVTLYVIGSSLNVSPYTIGQTIEEIYRTTLLDTEITITLDQGTYRFELSEEDLNIRPLVQLGDIYAQLAIDKFTGELSSVRFSDKKTLVVQSPYEMPYRGELITPSTPNEAEWAEIEKGSARQIFDITNVIRKRFELNQLLWNEPVAEVAYEHSKDMFDNDYFSHSSPDHGDLSERLDTNDIDFQAASENIALGYIDGPAVVEGWLNSEGHRTALLGKDFTQLGVGVYQKYYTQNFITIK
ncbi:CAP domain-containing protein [Bacillus sp. FSL K6-3431]|uniref:CAP domain-containing protein n=1 Tax=Bacillus sp. FSL K6-3431 TaxID=2921500 RepID=UPI0030FCC2F8